MAIQTLYTGPTAAELAQIPADLKALRQWVLFLLAEEVNTTTGEVKLTKIPYNPHTLRKASSTAAKTWGTFEDVLTALPKTLAQWQWTPPEDYRAEDYRGAGMGFVLTAADDYLLVDMDHSVDDSGVMAAWAHDILSILNSYSQYSVSGHGLHTLIKGRIPDGGNQHGNLQAWDHARFVAMTGKRLPETLPTIEPRQREFALVHTAYILTPKADEKAAKQQAKRAQRPVASGPPRLSNDAILAKAHAAKNHDTFARLWSGDWSGYDSQSEGDVALCCHLVFWTRDADQIDSLFRQSGLYREDKWNDRDDYRERTIAAALDQVTEQYDPRAYAAERETRQNGHTPGPGDNTLVDATSAEVTTALRARFRVNEHGVWFTPAPGDDGKQPPDVWVCAPLHIVAATCDEENDNHGHLLEFHDRHGHPQRWAMPLTLLEEQREYRKVLRRLGLVMNSSARKELQLYLELCDADVRARCVDRVGWHGEAYVLPDTTIGETGNERLVLQTMDNRSEGYRQAGTLEGWRTAIAARCVGNSRLLVAVSAAFAAPLLALTNEESGGLHFRGASSEGKTTALLIAATVWGEPGRLERWRTTANALEGVALAHNDNLLCLDELKELDPREAGGVAYMLGNGTGKRRGQPHGGMRSRLTWRLLFLSTGEMSLEQHMLEAGQRTYAGQEVRLVEVPADAGAGYGLFEVLHGAETGESFADALRTATGDHYGHAGRAFVTALAHDYAGNTATMLQLLQGFLTAQVPPGASGQVDRVAQRFGLIGAAGELATATGLTGWPGGVALTAAARCFADWLQARGGMGNADEVRALSQVRLFFERYGESRFKPWTLGDGATCERCHGSGRLDTSYKRGVCFDCDGSGTITSEGEPNRQVHDRAGFRRATADGRTEFYVLPEVFHHEMARGFDKPWLTRLLLMHGLLYRDPKGKSQCTCRLPGMGIKRVYRFKAEILGEETDDDPAGC